VADVLHGGPGAPADVLESPSRARTQLADRLAGSATDVLHGGPDAPRQLVQDLRTAIERGEHPVDDPCDVVEAYLELSLRLHARDAQVQPAEPHVGADIQLQQVQHLGLQRDMGPQVLDVQIDLVDLQHRNIETDVGARNGGGRITLFAAFVLFIGFRLLVGRLGSVYASASSASSSPSYRSHFSRAPSSFSALPCITATPRFFSEVSVHSDPIRGISAW
jgi:hypothetical protein